MPGLDPGISLSRTHRTPGKHVDGRIKCGHDVAEVPCGWISTSATGHYDLVRLCQAATRERKEREVNAMKMTTEEAFVKVLQRHGIEHVFGIIGSAFMPISDLFPKAGITFWDVAHESNAGFMCDGYTRATGKIAMCIGQNGPGITNLVTPVKTAYWNHTPLLLVTPQAANKTIGRAGSRKCRRWHVRGDGLLPGGGARCLPHGRGPQSGDRKPRCASRRRLRSTCRAISGPRRSISSCRRSCTWSARPAARPRSGKPRGCCPRPAFR